MLPSEATQSEQYGPVSVELRCDFPGTEVLLIDGQQQLVTRNIQEIKIKVLPGVYTARVRIGNSLRDEHVVVRPDTPVSKVLDPPPISSAIPFTGSTRCHEYHQSAVSGAEATETVLHVDGKSGVFVVLREWTPEGKGQRQTGPLAPELILRYADGSDCHSFNTVATNGGQGDRVIAQGVRVREGFYRLACRLGDAVIEMPIFALPDWHTQIYLLSQPTTHGLAPDFGRASVLWAKPGAGFDANRRDLKVLEAVRAAADSGRKFVTDKGLTEALYEKFENPMLGLVSAHALLQRNAIEQTFLAEVTDNLEKMLGPIPDVIALKLKVNPKAEAPPVEWPPVLRWSWQLLLQQSVDRPDLILRHSLAEQAACYLTGDGIWLSWLADAQSGPLGSATRGATDLTARVRQAWQQVQQVEQVELLESQTTTSRGARYAASLESLDVTQEPPTAQTRLKGMVEMLGVPGAAIQEAVEFNTLVPADLGTPKLPDQSRGATVMNAEKRKRFNERFLQRLLARRPQDQPEIHQRLQQSERLVPESALGAMPLESAGGGQVFRNPRDLALETIVNRERPVLFVKDGKFELSDVATLGQEAIDLVDRMRQQGPQLFSLLPLIGRIDVVNFPNLDFVGTGWFVDNDIVVTNRHVANLIAKWDGRQFAFARGVGGKTIESSLCNAHEFDDLAPDSSRIFKVKEVLYIEPDNGANDIAFLRVDRRTDGTAPPFIQVAANDAADEVPVCVIGYPARAPKRLIPDQELMKKLYQDRFDVKRAAPGFTSGLEQGSATHDCTTLGGNSGSVVLDLATGQAVGLHYAGIYEENNFAVRASVLTDYIKRKRWNSPPVIETRAPVSPPTPAPTPAPVPQSPAPVATPPGTAGTTVETGAGSITITIPLSITVSVGTQTVVAQTSTPAVTPVAPPVALPPAPPVTDGGPAAPTDPATTTTTPAVVDLAQVEQVVLEFWDQKPAGVLAARVGFLDDADGVGDVPCIAASVKPSELSQFNVGGPAYFKGVPVRYLPADIDEQVQALPAFESVDSIAYDDDARTGERFSFAPVNETMEMTLHVGPEYSWEVLGKFLSEAEGRMVSAIYEFHAPHIMEAIQERLDAGGSLNLVMDNATFSTVKKPDEEFDRVPVFEDWHNRFTFNRIVAPEGTSGLISDAYHIKVTVRDDDTFWLSSGNWKGSSSQPVITQEQRDNATEVDLPGNREWHVVIKNKKLASRFRNHILQDFARSEALGGRELPPKLVNEALSIMDQTFVDVPIEAVEESIVLERRAPSRILEPKKISKKVKVRPLLTPDQEGAVYSEAVLDLIQSAKESLLFQIPYIGMPSNPRQDRGYIDELIKALTAKLKTLDDARVILRSGGAKFSAPAHAAWFFKSKGVDIKNRLRVIDNHHTKGMIVDGKRVLLGSHNWSKPGVTLNRDASLIFDDADVASYYAQAFEIDWERANPLKPKRFVKESVVLEAVGDAPPPGFQRVRLSDLVKEDD
jgi:V8-like Glu-specific endopeptidase